MARSWKLDAGSKTRFFSLSLLLASSFYLLAVLAGCGPKYTYPADSVSKSIEKICHDQNKLDVQAKVEGKTIGAVYYVDDILDEKGQIPKDVHEKMGKIMQAVSRVSLSTDLPVDFCVVNIRDRKSGNELVITRSVDDTRRAQSEAIGVTESINRTLFGQGKYPLPSDTERKVGVDDLLSTDSLKFDLKEVKLETFLADQIAQRVRFGFAKESEPQDETSQALVLVDGNFVRTSSMKSFRFSVLSLKTSEPGELMKQVFKTVSDVISGYKFKDYDKVEILDYVNRQKLDVPKQALEDFAAKKITDQVILDRYMSESQSIQEAFKLFGFNLVDAKDAETNNPPLVTATP